MTQIDLSQFQNMMCLSPDTPEERARLGRDALRVKTADGDMLIGRARLEAARSFGNERVYNAAVRLQGQLRADQPRLAHRGITAHWARSFAHNKDVFYEMLSEDMANREAATAARLFAVAMELPGAKAARQIVVLAHGHWLEELLGVSVSELSSLEGLHAGIRRLNGRLKNPLIEERVLSTGIKKEELAQLKEAEAALHRMIDDGRAAEAEAAAGVSPLLVARAILWTEMLLVAAAARAELSEERWRLYQQPSLLEMAPRGPERRARPAPEEEPERQPGAGATPPVSGTPPVSVSQPGTGTASDPPATPVVAAAPAQPPQPVREAVPPGTPIFAVPPGQRDPVPVTLLPDGTLAWAAPTGRLNGSKSAPRRAPRSRKRPR